MEKKIILVVEHFQGAIKPISYELSACALVLKELEDADITAVILGEEIDSLAEEFSRKTGINILAFNIERLISYNFEVYRQALSELLTESEFSYCCIAHSSQGSDFAPALAVKLQAACITGVENVFRENEQILCSRSINGGKIITDMQCGRGSAILTIQPGSFQFNENESPIPGKVERRTVNCAGNRIKNIEIKSSQDKNSALSEAAVVVAVGRGIGKEENVKIIYRLAELFARAVVGGSRPLCDLGWLKYNQQIGVTGNTVSPDLYLACGISGASQHISGMKGSRFIVSINVDPNAAIFNVSDVCVVEDLNTFIPALIDAYDKKSRKDTE